ncbi:MAG: paraquat-inducible protein A [Janthinobacterium lividum]
MQPAMHPGPDRTDPQAGLLRECPLCGQFQTLPHARPGEAAQCLRCATVLLRGRTDSLGHATAYAVAAGSLLALALGMPFMGLYVLGRSFSSSLFTGPIALTEHGLGELGLLVLLTSVIMPVLKIGILLTTLLGLRMAQPPAFLGRVFAWYDAISPWAMIEVFLLGSFVAYTRLAALATVQLGPAIYAVGGVMLATAAADAVLVPEAVWEALDRRGLGGAPLRSGRQVIGCDCCGLVHHAEPGDRCPRCDTRLQVRRRNSIATTWALVCSALVLYVPANLLPVMTVVRYGRGEPTTISGGVIELVQAQMWPLAALVFFASILVPVLKLVGLMVMLVSIQRRSATGLIARTRLYRVVEFVGRWSMIDVFLLSNLVALVHMGFLANINPNQGDIYFGAVVVLTMFAARSFDPRLMWDAAAVTESTEAAAAERHAGASPGHEALA